MEYHVPVMLMESVEGLCIKPNGIYADLTFGGGGHTREILSRMQGGKLLAFDQDDEAAKNAEHIRNEEFLFIKSNFKYIKNYLKLYRYKQIDGILADLGVSSHQFDSAERGFSIRFDADLDMRMDRGQDRTAQDIINEYREHELHKIFGIYGEVKNAKTLANTIVNERAKNTIETTGDLIKVLDKCAPKHQEYKYYAQVFQALRIEVNEELKVLEDMLQDAADVLKPGGRLVILSYHSLEDRLVKNFINTGKFQGEVEKDLYGNEIKPFKAITRKPIEATEEEIKRNNRARSAKLRIAEKI